MHHQHKHSRIHAGYRMKGMGTLLTMYGQAGGMLEDELKKKKEDLKALKEEIGKEVSARRKEMLKQEFQDTKKSFEEGKTKLKKLFQDVKNVTSNAAKAISEASKSSNEKAKAFGKKSYQKALELSKKADESAKQYYGKAKVLGQKLSSGISTASSSIHKKLTEGIKKFNDKRALSQYYADQKELAMLLKRIRDIQSKRDSRIKTLSELGYKVDDGSTQAPEAVVKSYPQGYSDSSDAPLMTESESTDLSDIQL